MICAYDRVYLESARRNLARMLDFAVYDMRYDLQQFYHWFLMSGIAEQFGSGDYRFLAGMSVVELAYEVLDTSQIAYERRKPCYSADRSEEYWDRLGISLLSVGDIPYIQGNRKVYSNHRSLRFVFTVP